MKQRKRNRLQGYDYSQDNLYFITSCVNNRICCFGQVTNSKMILNGYGKIANDQWLWLAGQYPYVVLHEFVVMPNHMHGIIEINRKNILGRDGEMGGGTGRDMSLPKAQVDSTTVSPFSPEIKIKSLSDLTGAYKTTTSKQIHNVGFPEFEWQRSFHDHIIRNEKSYMRIAGYILNNPSTWEDDTFYGK